MAERFQSPFDYKKKYEDKKNNFIDDVVADGVDAN